MMEIVEKGLTLAGIIVTALATFALWRATRVLAIETKRMAEAASQPQIVVTIEGNQWSFIHADLHVTNTGNATAFDISIEFDPPLAIELENKTETIKTPLRSISILKPGQELTSWVGKMFSYLDSSYSITISYARSPQGKRESLTYILDMSSYKGIHRLGSGDPLTQLAQQTKKLQEDVHRIATGWSKLKVDIITSADREAEAAERGARWEAERQEDE